MSSSSLLALIIVLGIRYPFILWSLIVVGPLIALGWHDYLQTQHSILRNFPVIGHMRYLLETIRPEMYQYFVESDTEGTPFDRAQRNVVYQRSKNVRDTVPFGTQEDVYEVGYEWLNHSLAPVHVETDTMRLTIGGPDCTQPYSASLLNISAMSYGALSKNAVLALNQGAKLGNFAHNTGEGGVSPYHLQGGGDLIWQIGTGYFGCRTLDGQFCPETFNEMAAHPHIKMIELKLSQGAKPGHGGILPAAKVTPEIAEIRKVPLGRDILSPPAHTAFSTPSELMQFIANLRQLSGGKPVGFKLCVGKRREFLAICKAMLQTGITPDFITIDGGEGGTGAAPLEFTSRMGTPLIDGLIFVHNALVGVDLRRKIRLISSGKISTGFGMVKRLALGADLCNAARAMMMAVGCIQALKCNSNHCPVGVATQDPGLMAGLVVSDKKQRVANYHRATIESLSEMIGAMGISHPQKLRRWHVMRRISTIASKHYGEIYDYLEPGALLKDPLPPTYERAWQAASAKTFEHVQDG
jgi:glutamate synthase domain-containing protein 2